jgi:hypothetical protein
MMVFDILGAFKAPTASEVVQLNDDVKKAAYDLLIHIHDDIGISDSMIAKYMRCQKQNVQEMRQKIRPIPLHKLWGAATDLSYDLEAKGKELKNRALMVAP